MRSSGQGKVQAQSGQCAPDGPHRIIGWVHARRAAQYQVISGRHEKSGGCAAASDLLPAKGKVRLRQQWRRWNFFCKGPPEAVGTGKGTISLYGTAPYRRRGAERAHDAYTTHYGTRSRHTYNYISWNNNSSSCDRVTEMLVGYSRPWPCED